jgi:hypothetical protein
MIARSAGSEGWRGPSSRCDTETRRARDRHPANRTRPRLNPTHDPITAMGPPGPFALHNPTVAASARCAPAEFRRCINARQRYSGLLTHSTAGSRVSPDRPDAARTTTTAVSVRFPGIAKPASQHFSYLDMMICAHIRTPVPPRVYPACVHSLLSAALALDCPARCARFCRSD